MLSRKFCLASPLVAQHVGQLVEGLGGVHRAAHHLALGQVGADDEGTLGVAHLDGVHAGLELNHVVVHAEVRRAVVQGRGAHGLLPVGVGHPRGLAGGLTQAHGSELRDGPLVAEALAFSVAGVQRAGAPGGRWRRRPGPSNREGSVRSCRRPQTPILWPAPLRAAALVQSSAVEPLRSAHSMPSLSRAQHILGSPM